ncbi:glutamic acid-rich protein-like [Montipora foliosa]|uniref:glutamic acid-rich protein-like n=1 Tax=Montipora foliosa TaxID=591990 RepID=UPI0035F1F78B
MSSNELQTSLESQSTKSKKKDKSKKESKKDKKEKKKKRDSKDLDGDTVNNVGEDEKLTEDHDDETSPKSKKKFGLFRLSGRKSKSSKDGSRDSLKSRSRDSVDFEGTGNELSPTGSGSKEPSKPKDVSVDVNRNSEKTSFVSDSVSSNEAEAESTALKTSLSEEEFGSVVQSEMTDEGSLAVSKFRSNVIPEDTPSVTAADGEKGNKKVTTGENTSSPVAVPSAYEIVLEKDIKTVTTANQVEGKGVSNTVGRIEISKTGDVDKAALHESDIEGLIISSHKEKRAPEESDRRDEEEENPIDEEGLVIVYPVKQQIQDEKKQKDEAQEVNLMALSKDDETAKLIQVQVDELHKMNINSAEENWKQLQDREGKVYGEERDEERFDDKEKRKRSYERRVFVDQFTPRSSSFGVKKTGFSSSTQMPNIISTRNMFQPDLGHRFGGRYTNDPTVKESPMTEIEMKVRVVDGIKEVKKFSPMLLVRLKKINKKLVELRSQLLKLKDSGKDKATKVENEEMLDSSEVPQDEK